MKLITNLGISGALLSLAGTALSFSVSADGLSDPLVTQGKLRTEYASGLGTNGNWPTLWYVNNGLPGAEGCQFDAVDAFSGCPGRAGLPLIFKDGTWQDVWAGTLQGIEACNGDTQRIGDSWLGCLEYDQNTYYSAGNPGSVYWMIHANNDPSFDQCNSGLPGASEKVVGSATAYGLFKVIRQIYTTIPVTKYRIRFWTDLDDHNFSCGGQLPFLSVGAHNGRGNQGPVGTINRNLPTTIKDRVRFNFKIESMSAPAANWTGVMFIAYWEGKKRMLQLPFFGTGSLAPNVVGVFGEHWNWPIYESIFYPGSDVAILPVAHSKAIACGIGIQQITTFQIGVLKSFDFDVSKAFKCASDNGLFSTPMPAGNLPLEGIHFYTESSGTTGYVRAAFDSVQITN